MDTLRQSLGIITAVTMPLSSNIASIVGHGRSISDQSDASGTLLVPWGPAFSIWFPIFAGLLAYAVLQGLPANRTRGIYRASGWWMIGAMGLVTAWGVAAAFPPIEASRWLTAVIFVPAVICACAAMTILSLRKAELSTLEGWLVWAPVSLFAGWCSLAVFLNWAQLGVNGPIGFGLPEVAICVLCLALALAWIAWNLHRARGNRVYAFAPIWGLAFLALARLGVGEPSPTIGVAAIVGSLVLLLSSVVAGRRLAAADI